MHTHTHNSIASREILYQRPPRRQTMTEAEKIVARWMIGDRDGITEAEYRAALAAELPDVLELGQDQGEE